MVAIFPFTSLMPVGDSLALGIQGAPELVALDQSGGRRLSRAGQLGPTRPGPTREQRPSTEHAEHQSDDDPDSDLHPAPLSRRELAAPRPL